LEQGSGKFLVPLKNGRQMDIREVRALMTDLRLLRKGDPEHFQTLLALTQGRQEGLSQVLVRDLWDWRVLSEDLTVPQDIRDVLLSAGAGLEDPYAENIKAKFTVALAEEEAEDDFRKKLGNILFPDQGGKQGGPLG